MIGLRVHEVLTTCVLFIPMEEAVCPDLVIIDESLSEDLKHTFVEGFILEHPEHQAEAETLLSLEEVLSAEEFQYIILTSSDISSLENIHESLFLRY